MFFGDTRDLFKFDLVRHIMKAFPDLLNFTFVPMLTEEVSATGTRKTRAKDLGLAQKKGRAGTQNADLMETMGRLQEIDDDLEYFHGVRSYFKKEHIMVDVLHRDTFSHEHRVNYFNKMFENFPVNSLIFLDPDTGLEVKNPTRRHLLFDEVKKIFDRMDHQSVLIIYQHLPRVTREGYIQKRCGELAALTHSQPETITDNEIVFFILTKNPQLKTRLCAVLGDYADRYNTLISCDYGEKP
ncbi:MAG: hypothetical protein LUO98_10210 [Methanoregula sp.]|nr:hypothetical protein [Methanoregula sp.]